MDKTVLYWILCGGVGFAFVLAVQMRVMVALVLRRALRDWRPDFEDRNLANGAVMLAASRGDLVDIDPSSLRIAAEHLRSTYPLPLGHLRKARRYSVILPVILLALIAMGRLALGVF